MMKLLKQFFINVFIWLIFVDETQSPEFPKRNYPENSRIRIKFASFSIVFVYFLKRIHEATNSISI